MIQCQDCEQKAAAVQTAIITHNINVQNYDLISDLLVLCVKNCQIMAVKSSADQT